LVDSNVCLFEIELIESDECVIMHFCFYEIELVKSNEMRDKDNFVSSVPNE